MSRVGEVWSRDIVIGGRPVEALAAALTDDDIPVGAGEVWDLGIGHDDGCPAAKHGMHACDCEIVSLRATRLA
jgi:hypothetical protein